MKGTSANVHPAIGPSSSTGAIRRSGSVSALTQQRWKNDEYQTADLDQARN